MASTTFSQSKTPYTNYKVSTLKTEWTVLIDQPEGGNSAAEKVVRSMFLPVQSMQAYTPAAFLILKPKNLWLVKVTETSVKDIYNNQDTKIANYNPPYDATSQITLNFLPYPLLLTKLFGESSSELNAAKNLFGLDDIEKCVVLAEDANSLNRARIVAPNILGDNSVTEAFSRWL